MSRINETFDGASFGAYPNEARLKVQLDRVRSLMFDGKWRTLEEISDAIEHSTSQKCPTSSVSARLRDLRKSKFGAYTVKKRVREGHKGLWEYRVLFPATSNGAQP